MNHKIASTPELHLLFALIADDGAFSGDEVEQRWRALDWRLLVDTAGRHKLIHPLYQALEFTDIQPRWVRPALWARKRQIEKSASAHVEELLSIAPIFNRNEIQFRAMRGPVLSQIAFGDPIRRDFCDLDILVDRSDFSRAKQLLLDRGYHGEFGSRKERADRAAQMSRPEEKLGVDLHWSVVPAWLPLGSTFDVIEHAPMLVELQGHRIPTISREDTVLVQCVQCAKAAWKELDKWHDLAALVRKWPDLDWAYLRRVAGENGYARSLALTFSLLQTEFGVTSVPDPTPDQRLGYARQLLHQYLLQPPKPDTGRPDTTGIRAAIDAPRPVPYFASVHFHAAMWWLASDRLRDHCRIALWVFKFVSQPKDIDRAWVKLPRSLQSFYYLLRPLRLGATMMRRFLDRS